MYDSLLSKATYSGSRDLFIFWEIGDNIGDNISETVQDKDMLQ